MHLEAQVDLKVTSIILKVRKKGKHQKSELNVTNDEFLSFDDHSDS